MADKARGFLYKWEPKPAGMTNQWLKKQGLISIKELWVNIHYPATAR